MNIFRSRRGQSPLRTATIRAALIIFASAIVAGGCAGQDPEIASPNPTSAHEEKKVASGLYNDEIAYGPSKEKSLRIKVESAKIRDKYAGISAIQGEKLLLIELTIRNLDDKKHKIPIAGFTFAGADFDVPSANEFDQKNIPANRRFAGGDLEPSKTMRGLLVTRMPADRMNKPFLIGIWVDEKQQIWTKLCAREDDLAEAKAAGEQPLPKCERDLGTGHRLIHVKS